MSLILLSGQSNGIIPGVRAQDLPADLLAPDPMVRIWTGDHFEILEPGRNTGGPNTPDAVGPEVAFAARWRADHPGEVLYLVKSVKGSTGLAQDLEELDWSPRSAGELFDVTTAKLRAAQAALAAEGLPTDLSAILWIQGEQDAASAAKAGAYLPNVVELFQQMRSSWGVATTPIVLARLDSYQDLPFAGQVQFGQDLAAALTPRVAEVSTDALPLQADGLHYSAAGAIALGEELYTGLEALRHSSHGPAWAWAAGDFLVSAP